MKRVLVACEYSGTVRDAFALLGWDAWSCDILPSERPGNHIQEDVLAVLNDGWDLMIAHPPCTYLTVTGNKWMGAAFADRFPNRHEQRQNAINFFMALMNCSIPHIALENPVGIMSTVYRKPDQYIHPYHFGDPHSKKTGLWLKGLPPLKHTKIVEPQFHIQKDGRRDPLWHYESMRMTPHERMKYRSKTFQGIANAMAAQWHYHIVSTQSQD